ncbi:MAG: DUF3313 domain-containing protein [Halioglobus sp.]
MDHCKKTLIACTLLLAAACTSIPPIEQQFSGYLDDYSDMIPVRTEDGSDALRWYLPDLGERTYSKLWIKPIVFYPKPDTSSAQVSLERLNEISRYMTQALKSELTNDFELVGQAGPDTAILQFAITGVETPTEGLKPRNVIPVSLLISGVSYAAGERDHIVVVYLEGQATDAVSGETLAKGVRQAVGGRLSDDQEQLAIEHVQEYVKEWAADVATLTRNIQ